MPVIPKRQSWKEEDQKFKVIFTFLADLRPAWAV